MSHNPIAATKQLIADLRKIVAGNHILLEYDSKLNSLEYEIDQPCVLAIAGRVKAGKSSFLNALLGVDLAKVGTTETTATINVFRYGIPQNAERPVKVVWDSGAVTYESKEFMDNLQGNTTEVLQRAQGIKQLEFYLEKEILKEIILVDTPGTNAVVGDDGDGHQRVTEEFLNLRQKHQNQSLDCIDGADAILYLVGPVPTRAGQSFLDEFQMAAGMSSAINAMGVLSKVDENRQVLERRKEQAEYVANGMKEQLSTVVPVSAGLWQALQQHKERFADWKKILDRVPDTAFDYFMSSVEDFETQDMDLLEALYEDESEKPWPYEQRIEMKQGIMWSVFRTIATTLRSKDYKDAIEELIDISGIPHVNEVMGKCFFNRTRIIRCYKVIEKVERIVYDILHRKIAAFQSYSNRYPAYISFIDRFSSADSVTACEIQDIIKSAIIPDDMLLKIRDEILSISRRLEQLTAMLQEVDHKFSILHLLESQKTLFDTSDYQELCILFGLYEGTLPEKGESRQMYWNMVANTAVNGHVQELANYAVERYSQILNQ